MRGNPNVIPNRDILCVIDPLIGLCVNNRMRIPTTNVNIIGEQTISPYCNRRARLRHRYVNVYKSCPIANLYLTEFILANNASSLTKSTPLTNGDGMVITLNTKLD